MIGAVKALINGANTQGVQGVQGTEAVAGRRPSVRDQIDQLVNDPNIPKDQKVDILKKYRKMAAVGAVLNGAVSGMMAVFAGISVAGGAWFWAALQGGFAALGIKNTVDLVKNRNYAGEAVKKLESQPAQPAPLPPASQPQPAPATP